MTNAERLAIPNPTIPWEFERHAAEPPQLGLGRPGKVGVLDLELAPSHGQSRIVRSYTRVPLQAVKALYCDPARPDMAFVYVISVAGGVLQGDRLSIDVVARSGSRVHITTQAMTRVYRMTHGYATQTVHLRAETGGYLEYLPDPTIPFRGARYYQEVTLERAPGATILAGEILLPGRVASGESFAYDTVCFTTRGVNPCFDRIPRFQDTLLIEPARRDPHTIGLFGPYSVVGTLFVLSDAVPVTTMVDALASTADQGRDVALAATVLPNESGAMARVLSTTSAGAQKALTAAWTAARHLILGEGMPELRKY